MLHGVTYWEKALQFPGFFNMSEICFHSVLSSVCGLRALKICSMLIFTA